MIVYCAYNRATGKCYVGRTKHSVTQRIKRHLKSKALFGAALRKYGLKTFQLGIIDSADNFSELVAKEIFWIAKLNCLAPNGYNLIPGGEGSEQSPELQKLRSKITSERYQNPEERAKTGAAVRLGSASKASRKRRSKSRKLAFKSNPALITNLSNICAQQWTDPIICRKRKIGIVTAYVRNEELREQSRRMGKRNKGRKASKAEREARSALLRRLWQDPNYRANMLAARRAKS